MYYTFLIHNEKILFKLQNHKIFIFLTNKATVVIVVVFDVVSKFHIILSTSHLNNNIIHKYNLNICIYNGAILLNFPHTHIHNTHIPDLNHHTIYNFILCLPLISLAPLIICILLIMRWGESHQFNCYPILTKQHPQK